jgi:hypothetical protein
MMVGHPVCSLRPPPLLIIDEFLLLVLMEKQASVSFSMDAGQRTHQITLFKTMMLHTDLEFMLRPHCQKLRVVEKISGAHLMFPSESSLAVRVYFSCDLEDLLLRKKKDKDHDNDNDDDDGDFDNLSSFLKTFRLALVLFILPQNKQRQEQLDNPSSYFHRAQRIVRSMTLQNAGNDSSDAVVS